MPEPKGGEGDWTDGVVNVESVPDAIKAIMEAHKQGILATANLMAASDFLTSVAVQLSNIGIMDDAIEVGKVASLTERVTTLQRSVCDGMIAVGGEINRIR